MVVGWREGTAISIDIDIPIHAHVAIIEDRVIIAVLGNCNIITSEQLKPPH
jgi:hypothetical protein